MNTEGLTAQESSSRSLSMHGMEELEEESVDLGASDSSLSVFFCSFSSTILGSGKFFSIPEDR